MAEIINQIPGFENGSVQCVCASDKVDALFLNVILRKAQGIIEGLPTLATVGKRWLEQLAKSTNTSIVVVEVL